MENSNLRFSNILIVLSVSFLFSCKEDDSVLPPISMVGSNTFGCYVNGELWLPEGRGGGSLPVSVDRSGEFLLGIFATNYKNDTGVQLFIIDSSGLQVNKVYNFTNEPPNYGGYHFRNNDIICFFHHAEVISGSMTILKLESNIVSGTFEFMSFNPECGDTLKVTDGRFDIGKIAY